MGRKALPKGPGPEERRNQEAKTRASQHKVQKTGKGGQADRDESALRVSGIHKKSR